MGNLSARKECGVSQAKEFNATHACRMKESQEVKLLLAAVPSWREKNAGVPCVRLSYGVCVGILGS